jgi:Flp pilus assembly protein TadB
MTQALLFGALAGLGLALVVAGWRGFSFDARLAPGRVAPAAAVALFAYLVTRWPVAVVGGAAVGWWGPLWRARRRLRRQSLERTRAVAALAEMLRDTAAAGLGLADSLRAAARVAPAALAVETAALERRMAREPLPEALRAFADDVDDPLADRVVAALLLAERRSGSLEAVLSGLAVNAREEVALAGRVDASRAGLETSALVVAAVTVFLVGAMVVVSPAYLDPYGDLLGQAVLCLVAGRFAAAWHWLARLQRTGRPSRILISGGRL